MAIEETIETLLFSHVRDLDLDDTPLAWPNVSAEPAPPYVRVQHLRNNNTRLFVKGTAPHWRQGILQLTVVTPINVGSIAGAAVAGMIADQCPADLSLYSGVIRVRVQKAPDIATPELTDKSWETRVDIYYEALA